MNRFLKIRTSESADSIEKIASRARTLSINAGVNQGFEIEEISKTTIYLTWFERIITIRNIESDIFGSASFEEVKIIKFGIYFCSKDCSLLLIDPPIGRHRVLRVLRMLFASCNFIYESIDLRSTVLEIAAITEWRAIAIQTEHEQYGAETFLSISLSGRSDLIKAFTKLKPGAEFKIKSACFEAVLDAGLTRVVVNSTGLVRFSKDVTFSDFQHVINKLMFVKS